MNLRTHADGMGKERTMAFTLDTETPANERITEELQVPAETKTEMQRMAEEQVKELLSTDLSGMEGRHSISGVVDGFGKELMERSSKRNALLETRIGELSKAGDEQGTIAKSLLDLDRELRKLDPSALDFVGGKGLLGKIMNPMRDYFKQYEKSNKFLSETLERLDKGKNMLLNDNTTLEIEQDDLRKLTLGLGKKIELATAMDAALEAEIEKARAEGMDEEKVKFIEEEVLFPMRQRVADLQQMQAVNYQGYFAMEITRKNNKELIRAVDRAKELTMSALRTAIMVAASLYHQKIVLDCVDKVKQTTTDMIQATAKMMKDQGTQIQQQAMETGISPEALKQAYRDTFDALDSIAEYKHQALPKLKAAMMEFKEMAKEGERRVRRMENGYDAN